MHLPLWGWVTLVLVAFALLLRTSVRSFRRSARREFIAYLGTAAPKITLVREKPDRLVLRLENGEEGTFFLHNYYRQMADAGQDESARREVMARFVQMLRQTAQSPLSGNAEADQARLRPRIMPADFVTAANPAAQGQAAPLPHTPLKGTGLVAVYVLDSPSHVTYVTADMMEELGLSREQLHERALANLRPSLPRSAARQSLEKPSLSVFKTMDSYDAARLLLVPEHLEPGETLAACIPDRDTLVLCPAPADGNWDGMRKLALNNAGDPLLRLPLRVTRDAIEVMS